MIRLFLAIALILLFRVPAASAETYECVCLVVPAQDCSAEARMVRTGFEAEASSQIEPDNPANCDAKCSAAGPLCDACRSCLQSCQGGGKICQLWWEKPLPVAAGSDAGGPSPTVRLVNPLKTANVAQLISNILKAAVSVVGAFALLIFVYGGFLWLTSGGEAGKVQQGKDAMKWAIIGLFVVFSSYALVSFVLSALTG